MEREGVGEQGSCDEERRTVGLAGSSLGSKLKSLGIVKRQTQAYMALITSSKIAADNLIHTFNLSAIGFM